MRFIVPINEPEDGGSMTCHVIETGSNNARTNKRVLKEYFSKMGVPTTEIKTVMKAMGFWGHNLSKGNVGGGREATKS